MKIPSNMMVPVLALLALAIALLIGRPWITMTIVLLAYLVTIPFAITSYGKLKREAERIKASDDDDEDDNNESDDGQSEDEKPVTLRPV